jgi:hypothetical protein
VLGGVLICAFGLVPVATVMSCWGVLMFDHPRKILRGF